MAYQYESRPVFDPHDPVVNISQPHTLSKQLTHHKCNKN